jgi:hypothetical protein
VRMRATASLGGMPMVFIGSGSWTAGAVPAATVSKSMSRRSGNSEGWCDDLAPTRDAPPDPSAPGTVRKVPDSPKRLMGTETSQSVLQQDAVLLADHAEGRLIEVSPHGGRSSPADWTSHVSRTSFTQRTYRRSFRPLTSWSVAGVTTNSNIARSLTSKITRRAWICRSKSGVVVNGLTRAGVQVNPGRAPTTRRSPSLRGPQLSTVGPGSDSTNGFSITRPCSSHLVR